MFCSNCGHELEEGSNFCKNCGAQVNSTQKDISPISQSINEADEMYEAGMIAKNTNNVDRLITIAQSFMSKYPNDYRGYYLMLNVFQGAQSCVISQGETFYFDRLVDMALALAKTNSEKSQITAIKNAHKVAVTTVEQKNKAAADELNLKRKEITEHIEMIKKKNNITMAVIFGIFVVLAIIFFSTGDSSAPASGIMTIIIGGAIAYFVGGKVDKKIDKYKRDVNYYKYFDTPV